jgi:hypothetical protein
MWRGYGEHGNGVALVFDTAKLTVIPGSPLIIATVAYASDIDRQNILKSLLDQWADITASGSIPDEKLYLASHHALHVVKTFALTSKHIGFSEEKECRVIYYPELDTGGLLKGFLGYHIGRRGVEPKLKYSVGHIANVSAPDLSLDRLLNRIILGPSISSPLAKRSVDRMLEKIGKPQFRERVFPSTIPLRPIEGSSF